MKNKVILVLSLLVLAVVLNAAESGKPIQLKLDGFKENVFDYENNQQWSYKGDLPAIIDFYADWCGPCKQVAPIMKDLAEEYEGKIVIYKVDTDVERQLAGMFGIRSIPSILFIPMEGQPQMSAGALPKSEFVRMINEVLKVD
ncbi:MAG: thioredoxin [Candidatus Cloacimonadota bacterium]|nr:MAG: thioredoxin [Candidatus Cloacimonadota bacterium]RLC53632.1 MAG: thioredoxin [Candidatus Cloacimonadota bacterium]